MTSIYQQALGEDFKKLHPRIQERFGLASTDGKAAIGTGVMDRVWHGRRITWLFLKIGSLRNCMFPERGRSVPFRIENWAYQDYLGRETVSWLRSFWLPGDQSEMGKKVKRTAEASALEKARQKKIASSGRLPKTRSRHFDAYMIYSQARERIVEYLGTHQHLAVDIDLSVDKENGGLRLRSGEQRFYEGPLAFRFPMFFSGVADVCEWFDDALDCYRIEVRISNPFWGPIFGYSGRFDVHWIDANGGPPALLLPKRLEMRE